MTREPTPRALSVTLQPDWDPEIAAPGRHGLLAFDGRVRTLLRLLVSYPEVRYVTPDRVSLEAATDPKVLDAIARFLERQRWLVSRVQPGQGA